MHPETYKTFKALGVLLCYPQKEWLEHGDDLCSLLEQENVISGCDVKAIREFVNDLKSGDILDKQESYVDTFDRVRSLSLHLFEHVHGESRDRGQAMVDLAERYRDYDLELAASELPDYLPVFLEYLSLLPKALAEEELSEIGHILVVLGKRLAERGNPYHVVFNPLIRLAGKTPLKIEKILPEASISFTQLDREWEEKPIAFLGAEAPDRGDSGCGSSCAGTCSGSSDRAAIETNRQGAE